MFKTHTFFTMLPDYIKTFISEPRFNVYLLKANQDIDKAMDLYKHNIALSEALYPVLSILEVSLRNAAHEKLSQHFGDSFWFRNHLPPEFAPFVEKAVTRVRKSGKVVTSDAVIAELNLGFWDRLFNRSYAALLWKPLRLVFRNAPKDLRQRDVIADHLYRIRTLRNRICHHEPVLGGLKQIEGTYNNIMMLMHWMDDRLPGIARELSRFSETVPETDL